MQLNQDCDVRSKKVTHFEQIDVKALKGTFSVFKPSSYLKGDMLDFLRQYYTVKIDNFLLGTFFFLISPLLFLSHPLKKAQNLTIFKILTYLLFIDLETLNLFNFLHILALIKSTICFIDFFSQKNNNIKKKKIKSIFL